MKKMTVNNTVHNRVTHISDTALMKLLIILFLISFGER